MAVGDSNLRKILKPFLFLDAAWGEVISLTGASDDTGQLYSAGFGFQFSYKNRINGNLQIAFPLDENFSAPDVFVPDDSFKIVFDLQYSFQ